MAGFVIRQKGDFVKLMNPILSKVINNMEKDIRSILREYITKYVYDYGTTMNADSYSDDDNEYPTEPSKLNRVYWNGTGMPTYEFLNAWIWEKVSSNVSSITTRLFNDPTLMRYDPETYLHGSNSTGDMRKELANILNVDGVSSGDFPLKERKPYWDYLIEDLFDKGLMDAIFYKACEDNGLTIS